MLSLWKQVNGKDLITRIISDIPFFSVLSFLVGIIHLLHLLPLIGEIQSWNNLRGVQARANLPD